MSEFLIHWRLDTRTKTDEKARVVVTRFAELLGREITIIECERYWKDPAIRQVSAESTMEASGVEQLVYTALREFSRVGDRIELCGPIESADGTVEVDAYSTGSKVPGVEFVHLHLSYTPQR